MNNEDYVFKIILDSYGIGKEELVGKKKNHEIVVARWAAFWIFKKYAKLSYSKIGKIFNRDHTSVIHGVNSFNASEIEEKIKQSDREAIANLNAPEFIAPLTQRGKYGRIFSIRGGACEISGCGFDDVVEVHHLVSPKEGGDSEPSNLIIVCPNHHAMIHAGLIRFNPEKFSYLKIPERYVDRR